MRMGRSQLTGTKKITKSSPTSKRRTSLTSSVNTQKSLATSLKTLTSSSKKKSTTTSTAKAKVKSTKKTKNNEIKVMNSRKLNLFPWVDTFPIFLLDLTEDKKCWFTCVEHAQKYITRYNSKYKCYLYTGK